jgi:hypothetical protein
MIYVSNTYINNIPNLTYLTTHDKFLRHFSIIPLIIYQVLFHVRFFIIFLPFKDSEHF